MITRLRPHQQPSPIPPLAREITKHNMAKEKKIVEVIEEAPVEKTSKAISADKAWRIAHVANYAKANPVKYALKKAALEKWIEAAK